MIRLDYVPRPENGPEISERFRLPKEDPAKHASWLHRAGFISDMEWEDLCAFWRQQAEVKP